jgi:hypothetical protein
MSTDHDWTVVDLPDSPATTSSEGADAPATGRLWATDTGTLDADSRRTLVQLLRGPYLSEERHPKLWASLLAGEADIRSRLADSFLELVIDQDAQLAFVRNAESSEVEVPRVVRTAPLNFIQTVLLLQLRRMLLSGAPGERVFAGLDEVTDQLDVFRTRQSLDPTTFAKRVSAAWTKMHGYGILRESTTEGRSEISPVLRLIFGPEEIAQVTAVFDALAAGGGPSGAMPDDEEEQP